MSKPLVNGEVLAENICGKDLVLKPTFRALAAIERSLDCGITVVASRMASGGPRVEDMVVCLYHLAMAGSPKDCPTLDEIGEHVVQSGAMSFLKLVASAIMPALTVGAGKKIPKGEEEAQAP